MTFREQAVEAMGRAIEQVFAERDEGCFSARDCGDACINRTMECNCLNTAHKAADLTFTALLAFLDATGWQIVPKVATSKMCEAPTGARTEPFCAAWEAMLAAAPQPMLATQSNTQEGQTNE